MRTAKQFHDYWKGKWIDVDGAPANDPIQCVDIFKQCCYEAGMSAFSLGGSGYACEIYKRFKALGLDKYFTLVDFSKAQYGDWLIWDVNSKECPSSHVAMHLAIVDKTHVKVFGQNQPEKYCTDTILHTDGIIGVLRLKKWASNTSSKKSNSEIADEVIAGKWGNGTTRKQKLEAAEYDYETIQKLVNEKMGSGSSKKSNAEIAKEVIAGKWGNGSERQKKLEAAGYDYAAVQSEVNKQLGSSGLTSKTLKVGMKAKPKKAVAYDGTKLIAEVTTHKYTVIEIKGDRVVLGDGLNTAFKLSNLSY